MGSISSQKLAGLFKGLLFSPVTHILDSTGNGDTWPVTIWIQLLSAQRNWKGLHNGQTHPTSEAWLPWHQLEKSLCRPPPSHPTPPQTALSPRCPRRKDFPPFPRGLRLHLEFHSDRTLGGSSKPREGNGGWRSGESRKTQERLQLRSDPIFSRLKSSSPEDPRGGPSRGSGSQSLDCGACSAPLGAGGAPGRILFLGVPSPPERNLACSKENRQPEKKDMDGSEGSRPVWAFQHLCA